MLTLVVIAKDAGKYIERLLRQSRLYADVVMAFIDQASSDNTLDVCRPLVDHLETIDVPGYIEPILNDVYAVPDTEWVIRLDADELLGTRFVEQRDSILAKPENLCWLPRYNLAGRKEDYYFDRLYPDLQPRLFRRGTIRHYPVIHTSPSFQGNDVELNTHIFHVKYGQRPRTEREALMRHYDKILEGAGSSPAYRGHMLPEEMPVKTIRKCEEEIAQ